MSISASGAASAAGSNPYAALVQAQQSEATAVFGAPTDISALAPTAAAYPLYSKPGLLTGLTHWDGSQTPGSQRTPAQTDAAARPITPPFSFDPFNQKSWDTSWQTDSSTTSPDASSSTSPSSASGTAPGEGTVTGTGVVVPPPQYSFNPFDQKSWDVQSPKGSTIDALA
jgi:hypothetical protein